jgi:hypothetical protein
MTKRPTKRRPKAKPKPKTMKRVDMIREANKLWHKAEELVWRANALFKRGCSGAVLTLSMDDPTETIVSSGSASNAFDLGETEG